MGLDGVPLNVKKQHWIEIPKKLGISHWAGILVVVTFCSLFLKLSYRNWATEKYFAECLNIIEEGVSRTNEVWTRSQKLSKMKKAYQEAARIQPPWGADFRGVVRMEQMLQEGEEYFASANGEWTIVRDVAIGIVADTLDASGAMGAAAQAARIAKKAEIASDDVQRREFMEAKNELERYIEEKYGFAELVVPYSTQ